MKALADFMRIRLSTYFRSFMEEVTRMVTVKKHRRRNDIGLWMREKKEKLMRIC
jgi:hypothetical protein